MTTVALNSSVPAVVVAGYIAQDVIIQSESDPTREDFSRGRVTFAVGGSGANVAAWLAWTGAAVELVGVTGADAHADALIGDFEATGATATVARALRAPVVASVIDAGGDRHLVLDAGGPFNNVPFPLPHRRPAWLHIPGFLLYRDDLQQQTLALAANVRPTAPISVDLSSGYLIRTLGGSKILSLLSEVAPETVIMNEDEAEAMAKSCQPEQLAPRVVIHRGAKASRVYTAVGWFETSAGIRKDLRPLDATGAGDAFAAGYIAGIMRGMGEPAAIEFGHILAQIVITMPGGQPPLHDILDLARTGLSNSPP
ncbi:carbohydrate kinase family protein [Dactylosporangium sp. NPDC005572]|uniref:carbohydrate kinase family protein n=1 Tax=Dactylosporangium sp. NPDC005572 TaxID=3156889 RepID=UPI00339F98E9